MKHIYAALMISATILLMNVAFAQGQEPVSGTEKSIEIANLFTWAAGETPNWRLGALFAGLGVIGALVTIFGLIGGAVPGTAGQAKIDADTELLDRLTGELEKMIKSPSPNAKTIEAVEKTVDNLRDDIRAERWRQFSIAAVIYAVLGGFFAMLLARDTLQALAIGAGWTGFLGSLGLKRDFEERKSIKDETLGKLFQSINELERENKALREKKQGETYIEALGRTYVGAPYSERYAQMERDVFKALAV